MIKFKARHVHRAAVCLVAVTDSSSSWAVQLALGVARGEGSTELQPCSSYMRHMGEGVDDQGDFLAAMISGKGYEKLPTRHGELQVLQCVGV